MQANRPFGRLHAVPLCSPLAPGRGDVPGARPGYLTYGGFRFPDRRAAAHHLQLVLGTARFDLAMRVRNAVWRPPFVMYYRTCALPAVRDDLNASGFAVTTLPLTALGRGEDGSPRYRLVLARRAGTP